MTTHLTDATVKVMEALRELQSEERKRVIQAALTLLGEPTSTQSNVKAGMTPDLEKLSVKSLDGLHKNAEIWIQKNGIGIDQLQNYFHVDGGSVVAIALPGANKNKNEQTINSYLMQGVLSLFSTGDSSFSDADARALCRHFGCYLEKHHSTYLKEIGNRVTGSKSTGWKLTAPGLAAAAALLKLAPESE